ncbi:MAG: SpoIIE family protein phosphatase, partial [Myxococcales bacterium]|nr:SpoIIE family protein phosphatase [Myxococcales bacterium]
MLKAIKSLPISVKLMATTTLLLVFTVGLYGVMNLQGMSRVYDESRAEQQSIVLRRAATSADRTGDAIGAMAGVLLAAGAYSDLDALLKRMAQDDPRLRFVEVFEGARSVARAGDPAGARAGLAEARDLKATEELHAEVGVFTRDGALDLIIATAEFESAGIKGRVEAGWSIQDIAATNARIEERYAERKQDAMTNALFVGGLIILLGIVLTILQSLRISRPLRDLSHIVDRIAHGNLSERALVDARDEIGVLARNFNYMAEQLGVLLTETKEKATYEKEMEVARVIQESLLPPSRVIDAGFFQFIGYFKSASICGGDWWNYAELSGGRLLILIGDVTGHGVSSAMITAAAKSCCDTLRHVTEGELTVTFLLEELNKTIYEAANRKFVMTFFATIIDPRAGTLTFSNAGHNFPLLFRAQPPEGEPAVVPLVTRGNRLGDVMESRFLERTVPYGPGDVLVWYTDGITEGLGKDGQEYGEKRFRRSIRAMLDKGPDEILEKVLRDAEGYFADFAHPEDDITLVVGKFPDRALPA